LREIANIGGKLGVWGYAPSGVHGRAPGQEVWGKAPQKLKSFRCISSNFLYFLEGIVEIQHLDVIFTATAGDAPE